jgi:radical SAM enzyme (TIGR01210 family)
VDPTKPHHSLLENERLASGEIALSAAIFLTNKECPWRCVMCDLWKNTLPGPTPPGAIPAQINYALDRLGRQAAQIKLYNSGSFFDPGAIPPQDYPAIAECVSFTRNLLVESHPRLVGARVQGLLDLLGDTRLEVAMGLETIHPEVVPRLNKGMTPAHFAIACEFLRKRGVAVRAFVLVNPPFLDALQARVWAVKSAAFAYQNGASAVSLIPTRRGNGALDLFEGRGDFCSPTLENLEEAFEAVLALGAGRAFADTWDLRPFSLCGACLETRTARLNEMNLSQKYFPRVECPQCAAAKRR